MIFSTYFYENRKLESFLTPYKTIKLNNSSFESYESLQRLTIQLLLTLFPRGYFLDCKSLCNAVIFGGFQKIKNIVLLTINHLKQYNFINQLFQ
jgi:hypothetical protein